MTKFEDFFNANSVIISGYSQSLKVATLSKVGGIILDPPSIKADIEYITLNPPSIKVKHSLFPKGITFSLVKMFDNSWKIDSVELEKLRKKGDAFCFVWHFPFFLNPNL
jgi:hypothetical protein